MPTDLEWGEGIGSMGVRPPAGRKAVNDNEPVGSGAESHEAEEYGEKQATVAGWHGDWSPHGIAAGRIIRYRLTRIGNASVTETPGEGKSSR